MPRTLLAAQALGLHGGGLDSVTFTAGDSANGHYFLNSGRELLIMTNTNAAIKSATVVSIADPNGRTGDKTIACPALTGVSVYGPFPPSLFSQRNADRGRVHIDLVSATNVSFGVVRPDVPAVF